MRHDYEIRRNEDGTVDEIVAKGADFHLEQLGEGCWWVGIQWPDGERLAFNLVTGRRSRAKVHCVIHEEPR